MTKDKEILIRNVYHMLAYAFRILTQKCYEEVEKEKFENIHDLFAAILSKGVSKQLKQGLYREYITIKEDLPTLRGKLQMSGTINNSLQKKRVLSCEHDELSVNNVYNQIIKTTMIFLVKNQNLKSENKASLKKVLLFFSEVDTINLTSIKWNMLKYQKNNKNYEMLLNICYFVLDGMIQTTEKGQYKMSQFSDDHMCRLYERFVLEYYKRHHFYLDEIKAGQIKWNISNDTDEQIIRFLPVMQTDIFLRYKEQVLIIDTKYYSKTMQKQYDKVTLHSGNMYQIFTYVKNQDVECTGNVSGLLLYAKTDENITPDCNFKIGGNKISVKTLDLNKEFHIISEQLDDIIQEHFVIK